MAKFQNNRIEVSGEASVTTSHNHEVPVQRLRAALHLSDHDYDITNFSLQQQETIRQFASYLHEDMTMEDLEILAQENVKFGVLMEAIKDELPTGILERLDFAARIPMMEMKQHLLPGGGAGYYVYGKFVEQKIGADLAKAFREYHVSGDVIKPFIEESKVQVCDLLKAHIKRVGFKKPEDIAEQIEVIDRILQDDQRIISAIFVESTAYLLHSDPAVIPKFFEEIERSQAPTIIAAGQLLRENISSAVLRAVEYAGDTEEQDAIRMDFVKKLPRDIAINDSLLGGRIDSIISNAHLQFASHYVKAAAKKIFIATGNLDVVQNFVIDVSKVNDLDLNEKILSMIVAYVCSGEHTVVVRIDEIKQAWATIQKMSDNEYYQRGMLNMVITSNNHEFISEYQQKIGESLKKIKQWPEYVAVAALEGFLFQNDSYKNIIVNCEVIDALNNFACDSLVPDAWVKSVIIKKQFGNGNPIYAQQLGESISKLYVHAKYQGTLSQDEQAYLRTLATIGTDEVINAQSKSLDKIFSFVGTINETNKLENITREYFRELAQTIDINEWDKIAGEAKMVGEILIDIQESELASDLLFRAFKEDVLDANGLKERVMILTPLISEHRLTSRMTKHLTVNLIECKSVAPTTLQELLQGAIRELLKNSSDHYTEEVAVMFGAFDTEMKKELRENAAEVSPVRLGECIKALLDPYSYSFSEDEADAIAKSKNSRELAKQLLDKIPAKELDKYLPLAIEHSLDIDFGDKDDARMFIRMSKDPIKRAEYEKMLTQKQETFEDRIKKFNDRLRPISAANAARDRALYSERYGREVFEKTFQEVKKSLTITINANLSSLERMLTSGSLKSCWEAPGKRHDRHYLKQRHRVERLLGIRSKGSQKDPHPIYGAVAAMEESSLTGASPLYGEIFIKLRTDRIKDRISVCYDDSFRLLASPETSSLKQFCFDDIAVARTCFQLHNQFAMYVEAQIQGVVTIDDIESINIPLYVKTVAEDYIVAIIQKYPNITINFV